MSKLKPCPFCGVRYPYITFERGYIDDSAVVFCNACKISVKLEENDQEGFNDAAKEKAIEAWNRRASVEPERKKGEWVRWYEEIERDTCKEFIPHCKCSECGTEYDSHTVKFINFCPNCGADMRGEEDETD